MFLFLIFVVVSIVLAGAGGVEGRRGNVGRAAGFLAAAIVVLALVVLIAFI